MHNTTWSPLENQQGPCFCSTLILCWVTKGQIGIIWLGSDLATQQECPQSSHYKYSYAWLDTGIVDTPTNIPYLSIITQSPMPIFPADQGWNEKIKSPQNLEFVTVNIKPCWCDDSRLGGNVSHHNHACSEDTRTEFWLPNCRIHCLPGSRTFILSH